MIALSLVGLAVGSLSVLVAVQLAASRGLVVQVPEPPLAGGVPQPSPAPTGTPALSPAPAQPAGAPPAWLSIPDIGVSAPVTIQGVDERGAMLAPDGLDDVAWYDFSARPGERGNVVFSGHYGIPSTGPAVFASLKDLAPGDVIEVRSQSGDVHTYRVEVNVSYPVEEAPVADIVGPSPREVVTLITCDGTFNPTTQDYSHRRVVRAARWG